MIGVGITNGTIIWKDIANTGTLSIYNPVVNMIPWKEKLTWRWIFLVWFVHANDLRVVNGKATGKLLDSRFVQ